MTSMTTHIAIASDRCSSTPENVDAFGVARRGRVVVVASVARRRTDIARELVRKLIDRIENAAPTLDAFGYVPAFLDQIVADPASVGMFIGAFEGATLSILASPEVRSFRYRNGALESLTSTAAGLARTTHDVIAGDSFAICTEGVYTMISEATIRTSFRDHLHPRDVAWALVDAGKRAHSRSDVTAIVVGPLPGYTR
jgi:hypothetical protein